MPSICLCPRLFKSLPKKGISNPSNLGLSLVVYHLVMTLPSTVRTINKPVTVPIIVFVFATECKI